MRRSLGPSWWSNPSMTAISWRRNRLSASNRLVPSVYRTVDREMVRAKTTTTKAMAASIGPRPRQLAPGLRSSPWAMALIGSCVVIGVSQTTPHRSLEHTVTLQQERAAIEPPFLHARPAQRIPSVCASCRPGKLSMAADLERTNEIIAHATIELAGPIAQTTLAALTRRSDGLDIPSCLLCQLG